MIGFVQVEKGRKTMPPKQPELFRGTVYATLSTGEVVEIPGLKDVTIVEADEILGPIDYVRVVRCKDCKFFSSTWDGFGFCRKLPRVMIREYDYCSSGERRENDETD